MCKFYVLAYVFAYSLAYVCTYLHLHVCSVCGLWRLLACLLALKDMFVIIACYWHAIVEFHLFALEDTKELFTAHNQIGVVRPLEYAS